MESQHPQELVDIDDSSASESEDSYGTSDSDVSGSETATSGALSEELSDFSDSEPESGDSEGSLS